MTVTRLPYDYSRCPGTRCDVRDLCARNTAEMRQPVSIIDHSTLGRAVTRSELCSNFIPAGKKPQELLS